MPTPQEPSFLSGGVVAVIKMSAQTQRQIYMYIVYISKECSQKPPNENFFILKI